MSIDLIIKIGALRKFAEETNSKELNDYIDSIIKSLEMGEIK